MISNLSILSSADDFVTSENGMYKNEDNSEVQPLYDIIHSITLDILDDGVDAVLETMDPTSLQITITVYQQKGSGWSLLAKKTFSSYGRALLGNVSCDFQPGVTYKAVANFNAGGETDSMEDIFSF